MKQIFAVCIIVLVAGLVLGWSVSAWAVLRVTTGMHVHWVRDDLKQDTQGTEIIIPLFLRYNIGRHISISLDTGYADAQVRYPNADDVKLAHLTDALLNVEYAVPGLPFNLSAGLTVNLPVGKERLSPDERRATLGENNDLFGVEQFGEGLNVGLSLVAVQVFDTFGLGLSGAYVTKGSYDVTQEIADDTFEPGDQFMLAGMLLWQPSETTHLSGMVAYSGFGVDRVNGEKDFQEGAGLGLSGELTYRYGAVDLSVAQQVVLPGKQREHIDGSLREEADNSVGITLKTSVGVSYSATAAVTVGLLGDVTYYGESERRYSENDLLYAGQRLRSTLGGELEVKVMRGLTWNNMARYLLMREAEDLHNDEDRNFEGLHLSSEITYVF